MRSALTVAIYGECTRRPVQTDRRVAARRVPRNLFVLCPHPTLIGNHILQASGLYSSSLFGCCCIWFHGRSSMRTIAMVLLLSALVMAQASSVVHPTSATTSSSAGSNELIVPAGTKVPLALKHAVSTKSAREGDSVYAETTFPVVQDNRVLIPAGTYVQGRITHVQRAGRIKGRAEVLMHFTTLIYPSGY